MKTMSTSSNIKHENAAIFEWFGNRYLYQTPLIEAGDHKTRKFKLPINPIYWEPLALDLRMARRARTPSARSFKVSTVISQLMQASVILTPRRR